MQVNCSESNGAQWSLARTAEELMDDDEIDVGEPLDGTVNVSCINHQCVIVYRLVHLCTDQL